MKKLNVLLLALIIGLLTTVSHAQIAEDQARNFQINETHTGSVYSAGLAPPLKQKWSVNFGQSISYPLIADGKVFVTVRNASAYGTRLYALDAANGSTVWSYPLGGVYYWSALCYESERVFAINGDGLLRGFDAADGTVLWSRQLPGQYSFSSAPTVFQGVIYTGGAGSGGTAYAVNAENGDVLWSVPVANGSQSSPVATTDGIYVSYSCPNVYKLKPSNGALIWKYSTGCSGGGGKTLAFYNGRLYVRDYNPDYIFDSVTGAIAGTYTSKHVPAFSGNMGFFLNGPKYFGSFGTLEGRDVTNNNSLVWSFAGDGYLQSSVLVVNDFVYVGSDRGRLYAVEAATGHQVWTTNVGVSIPYVDEQNVSQPLTSMAAGEGILVVPTRTILVAYEGDHTPTMTWGQKTPPANAYGWNNTPVDLPFTATANPPGVTFSTPGSPLHFTAEGANQAVQVTVTDQAGNSATFTSPAGNIDWTAPVTSRTVSGTTGNDGWYKSAVQISLSATDNLSGVAARYYKIDGEAAQVYAAAFTVSTSGSHTINYWSMDQADNTEAARSLVVNIDLVGPAITATANPSTAPKSNRNVTVTISGQVTDTPSGVKPNSTTYSVVDEYGQNQPSGDVTLQANGSYSFTLSLPATRKGNDSDGHLYTITVRSNDQAGNSSTASTTLTIL